MKEVLFYLHGEERMEGGEEDRRLRTDEGRKGRATQKDAKNSAESAMFHDAVQVTILTVQRQRNSPLFNATNNFFHTVARLIIP